MKTKIIVMLLVLGLWLSYIYWQQKNILLNESNNIIPDNQDANNMITNTWNTTDSTKKTNWIMIIEITAEWFVPSTITINAWDRVDFVNKDSAPHWPASWQHPLHTNYPWSWLQKCWTSEEPTIFDACKWLVQNEVYSFVFNEKWTWWFHDHFNPSMFGSITVK